VLLPRWHAAGRSLTAAVGGIAGPFVGRLEVCEWAVNGVHAAGIALVEQRDRDQGRL
jgi:hypothetical protein